MISRNSHIRFDTFWRVRYKYGADERSASVIVGQFYHKGYFHVMVLVDDQVRYVECPVSWFNRRVNAKGQVEVDLVWPPPYQPGPPRPDVDSVLANDGVRVARR